MVGHNIQWGDLVGNIKSTLLELVIQNFSEINKKRRLNKKNNKKTKSTSIHNSTFSISTILMNSAIRGIKNKEKEPIKLFENLLGDFGKTLDKGIN